MINLWLEFQGRFTNIYFLKGAASALVLPSFILLRIKLVAHQNLSLQNRLWRIIPDSIFMCLDILQSHCASFGIVFLSAKAGPFSLKSVFLESDLLMGQKLCDFKVSQMPDLSQERRIKMLQKNQVLGSCPFLSRHSPSAGDLLYVLLFSSFTSIAEKYFF